MTIIADSKEQSSMKYKEECFGGIIIAVARKMKAAKRSKMFCMGLLNAIICWFNENK
jgi:hypothetical protein